MGLIEKYAKIHGENDSDDQMSAAGCDEVNYSHVEFMDDESNAHDQIPSDYRLMNAIRDLKKALQDQSMSVDLVKCSDPEYFVSDYVEEVEYEFDEFKGFK